MISYHPDIAKTMLKPAKADQETFGKGQQIKKGVQQWSLL